jgi:hypothetical protein
MPERTLEHRYLLLAAGFRDGPRGVVWEERLEGGFKEALGLLAYVLAHDLALAPQGIDREQLRTMVGALLPGRLVGNEPYKHEIVDLLEDFLMFVAGEEGLTTQWEWSSAIDESREGFVAAMRSPSREAPPPARHLPDRRPAAKIGRNDPCPCGSGKKYKHCCLRL